MEWQRILSYITGSVDEELDPQRVLRGPQVFHKDPVVSEYSADAV